VVGGVFDDDSCLSCHLVILIWIFTALFRRSCIVLYILLLMPCENPKQNA
jgi:phage shock protein PspC (stress-responsive transcriptional regulator)